jgi:uncharacterized membrane protein YgcG
MIPRSVPPHVSRKVRALAAVALAVVVLAAAGGAALADRGGYVIRSFHTDLDVQRNGDVVVTERLEVEFEEPRHGIYRTIPVRYTDPRGFAYALGFRLLGVEDGAGGSHRVKTSQEGRDVNLRIGDPDRTVEGRVTYVIRYRVRDALVSRPEHDELYWNATGTEWAAGIGSASATVRLPAAVDDAALEKAAYVGRLGSTEQGVAIERPSGSEIAFRSPRPLGPLEGLTVAVAWPRGIVERPSALASATRLGLENWILAAPLAALCLWIWQWRKHGRDPRGRGSIVVRYEAPEGVTPGEIGAVVDEKVDTRDITATLVDLAVRGYVRIRVEEQPLLFGLFSSEKIVLERQREGAGVSEAGLPPHERRMLEALFSGRDEVEIDDLRERFYRHVPGIRDALLDRVTQRGYFAGKPTEVQIRWALIGLGGAVATFLAGALWAWLRGGILPQALGVPAVAAIVTAVVGFAFAQVMPRRTAKGVELREWALGFEEFVHRVEAEKLEQDRARNVFEALLPYAMALGIAAAWARRFEGIYEHGAPPAWFVGRIPSQGFSTRGFERSLSSAMSRTAGAMTQAPRSKGSSGSGGGGSSGGGGGGGGGGSW